MKNNSQKVYGDLKRFAAIIRVIAPLSCLKSHIPKLSTKTHFKRYNKLLFARKAMITSALKHFNETDPVSNGQISKNKNTEPSFCISKFFGEITIALE